MKKRLFTVVLLTASTLYPAVAHADRFDSCPDPQAARRYVNSCLQENPYNTQETCEARALEKLCSSGN